MDSLPLVYQWRASIVVVDGLCIYVDGYNQMYPNSTIIGLLSVSWEATIVKWLDIGS